MEKTTKITQKRFIAVSTCTHTHTSFMFSVYCKHKKLFYVLEIQFYNQYAFTYEDRYDTDKKSNNRWPKTLHLRQYHKIRMVCSTNYNNGQHVCYNVQFSRSLRQVFMYYNTSSPTIELKSERRHCLKTAFKNIELKTTRLFGSEKLPLHKWIWQISNCKICIYAHF